MRALTAVFGVLVLIVIYFILSSIDIVPQITVVVEGFNDITSPAYWEALRQQLEESGYDFSSWLGETWRDLMFFLGFQ